MPKSPPPYPLSLSLGPADLRFERLFGAIREAVVVADAATGRVVLWNPAAERLFGYSAAEAAGLPLEALLPDRLKARYRETGHSQLLEVGRLFEVPALRKDGAEVTVELTLSPIEGAPVGGRFVLAILRDLVDARHVEEGSAGRIIGQAVRAKIKAATERLHRLQALTEVALAELTVDHLLRVLLDRVRESLSADLVAVLLLEGKELVAREAMGLDPALARGVRIPLGKGFAGRIAAERQPVMLEDVDRAEVLGPVLRRKRVTSLLGVPLLVEGRVLGVLLVGSRRRRRFTEQDTRLLQFFGHRVALTHERARLRDAERQARAAAEAAQRRASILAEASRAFAEAASDVRAVPEALVRRLVEVLGEVCLIWLLSEDGRRLELVALHARDPEGLGQARDRLASCPLRVGEGLAGRVAQTGGPLLLPSVSLDDLRRRLRPEHVAVLEWVAPRSLMVVPFRARGRVLGTLSLARRAAFPPYAEDDLDLLQELADRAALAVENARLYGALAERERQLQELVGRLILAQEEERRHVAYEVHDGVAQVVAGAHLHLRAFARRYRPDLPDARAELDQAVELAQRAVREARTVVGALRPTVLDDLGLAAALHAEVEELRKAGWQVDLETKLGPERLDAPVETALFRVAQEALANARKHAQTTRARVAVRRTRRAVKVEVRDWGRGFRPGAAQPGAGPGERVGLSGMKERVALLGGRCEVRSRPGAGTRIVAEVPLRALAEPAVAEPTGSA